MCLECGRLVNCRFKAEEKWIDTKELIARIIFFHGDDAEDGDYVRPHEETCHVLAENIMKALGMEEPS